ncbi:LOW QUALITY PROTEIN: transcription repressor KAN1 [Jatropha curcas]|uniref:LOW QUALITY PROTEIN: transcription repressor KAN1 n=1 Tax=Jatropha curcas TaxID=180498 RepID=UPI001893BAAE|nr:LOW QUALITY PROTEIN: transcription repressor KAN1 [Jatropha curcas]
MPLEGVFIEPSTNPVPDLSLHISPPNISPSSLSNTIINNKTGADTSFNFLVSKSNNTSTVITSMRNSTSDSQAYTELSLAHPSNSRSDQESPHIPYHYQQNSLNTSTCTTATTSHLSHLNHGVSRLDVSDGLRPIKGIPVYHNRSFPFLPSEQSRDNKDPKMCFYPMLSYPSSSSSSVPYYIGGGASLDPMYSSTANHHHHHHHQQQSLPAYSTNRLTPTTRFSGLSIDAFKSHHQLHHHQYGVGSGEASHGLIRSRFLPKLPTKRSMRAPRMRWTTTLHNRFVHAVELLGGHERATPKQFLNLMDVKDLTLASCEEMYRTVKTTDKPAASSGQSDGSGEDDLSPIGSTGNEHRALRRFSDQRGPSDGSLQQEIDFPSSASAAAAATTLWSNSSSSREQWPQTNSNDMDEHREATFQSQQRSGLSIEECSSNRVKSYLGSNLEGKNPSLEFTLGRPDWQGNEHY